MTTETAKLIDALEKIAAGYDKDSIRSGIHLDYYGCSEIAKQALTEYTPKPQGEGDSDWIVGIQTGRKEAKEEIAKLKSELAALKEELKNAETYVVEYTPERAQYLLNVRDALVNNDIAEAYHFLGKFYNPPMDKYSDELWKDVEEIAAEGDFEKYNPNNALKSNTSKGGMKWVRIEDGLPEVGETVIVYTSYTDKGKPKNDMFSGYMDEYGELYYVGDADESYGWQFNDCVTHWRKLPNPPESGEAGQQDWPTELIDNVIDFMFSLDVKQLSAFHNGHLTTEEIREEYLKHPARLKQRLK